MHYVQFSLKTFKTSHGCLNFCRINVRMEHCTTTSSTAVTKERTVLQIQKNWLVAIQLGNLLEPHRVRLHNHSGTNFVSIQLWYILKKVLSVLSRVIPETFLNYSAIHQEPFTFCCHKKSHRVRGPVRICDCKKRNGSRLPSSKVPKRTGWSVPFEQSSEKMERGISIGSV